MRRSTSVRLAAVRRAGNFVRGKLIVSVYLIGCCCAPVAATVAQGRHSGPLPAADGQQRCRLRSISSLARSHFALCRIED